MTVKVRVTSIMSMSFLTYGVVPAVGGSETRLEFMSRNASADLLVLGPALVVRPAGVWVDAVAIRGDRIMALGESARAARGPGTAVIDARDGLILPGFVDAHVHPGVAGRNLLTLDLSEMPNRAADLVAIATAARTGSGWLTGGGWSMEHYPGGLPTAVALDAVTAGRPAFLYNRDVHGAWVNSAALRLGGITAATPDPPDGRIERDHDGRPTGVLHEGAAHHFETAVLPAPSEKDWQLAILAGQAHLHGLGVTGWQDAWVTDELHRAYRTLAANGTLTGRVVGALWWDRTRGIEQLEELQARRSEALGELSPDQRQDHGRRGDREPHGLDAGAVPRPWWHRPGLSEARRTQSGRDGVRRGRIRCPPARHR